MHKVEKPYALITGASKGIGKSMAISLAKKKYNLLLVARSEDILKDLSAEIESNHGVKVAYKAIDLVQKEVCKEVADWARGFDTSILINNAGYALWGWFENFNEESNQDMMQLNMSAPVSLITHMLPQLKAQKEAYILNIASTAAYQAVPSMALYAATKAFIRIFTRGLRLELRRTNISVSVVCPGPTHSHFTERASMQSIKEMDTFAMSSEDVAKASLEAMFSKKSEKIIGVINFIGAFANRILPAALIEKVASSIYMKYLK